VVRKATDHGLLEGEEKLIGQLTRYGFQPLAMENYSLREKAWLLGRAEAIIGPSGGGLANVVFCSPGTKVIELRVQPVPVMEAWDIANRCKLDFYDVLPSGYGEGSTPATDQWGMVARGSVADADILATLELAGLLDQQARR
jgi:capsular polysaccharide biosynthesis protein